MSRFVKFGAAFGFVLFTQSALADTTTYEFTAKNNSAAAMTVSIDGKVSCSIEAGKTCRLSQLPYGSCCKFTKWLVGLTLSEWLSTLVFEWGAGFRRMIWGARMTGRSYL